MIMIMAGFLLIAVIFFGGKEREGSFRAFTASHSMWEFTLFHKYHIHTPFARKRFSSFYHIMQWWWWCKVSKFSYNFSSNSSSINITVLEQSKVRKERKQKELNTRKVSVKKCKNFFLSSPVKPESNGALPVHFSSVVFYWRRRKRWRVVSHVETYRTKFISSLSLIWQISPLTDFPSIDWKDRDGMQSRDGDGKVVCVFLTLSGGKEVFERKKENHRCLLPMTHRNTAKLHDITTNDDKEDAFQPR